MYIVYNVYTCMQGCTQEEKIGRLKENFSQLIIHEGCGQLIIL